MRRTTIATVIAGLVLVAGACGTEDANVPGGDMNTGTGGADVPATTETDGTETTTGSAETSPGDQPGGRSPEELFSSMSTAARDQGTAQFTISSSEEAFGTGDGQLEYTDDGANLSLLVTTTLPGSEEPQEIELIVLDRIVYMGLGENSPIEQPWVRIDPAQEHTGTMAEAFAMVAQQLVDSADPTSQLEAQAEAAEITGTGEEEIDGTTTTRYDLQMDIATMAENAESELERQRLQTAVDAGMTTIDYQMWVDENDLPVRFVIMQPGITGNFESAEITVDYSQWGEPVDIAAPPEEETGELPAE